MRPRAALSCLLGFTVALGAPTSALAVPVSNARSIELIGKVPPSFQIAEIQAFEAGTGTNKALASQGGVATASSSDFGTNPGMAIDGNTDGNFGSSSTWHSNEAPPAGGHQFKVTFNSDINLDKFTFFGRTDCCQGRQNDFDLIVRDSSDTIISTQKVLGFGNTPGQSITNFPAPPPPPVPVPGVTSIELRQNKTDSFQIAEIQAFEPGSSVNKALSSAGALTSASSSAFGTNPGMVNDGNTDGNFGASSTWHSADPGAGQVIRVDFASPITLDRAGIFNRTDCCGDRQSDFYMVLRGENGEVLSVTRTGTGTILPAVTDPVPTGQWNSQTFRPLSGNINNLAQADSAIATGTMVGDGLVNSVNYHNPGGGGGVGNFGGDINPFGLGLGNEEDFVVKSTGFLQITQDGNFQFRNNTDDGSRLRIDLNGDGVFGPGETVILDDVLSGPHNADSAVLALVEGQYMIEHVWFERGGGAEGDLGINAGSGVFHLLGNPQNDGLNAFFNTGAYVTASRIIPEPTSALLGVMGIAVLGLRRRRVA